MGKRLIAMAMASVLALATTGFTAEKAPAKSTKAVAKSTKSPARSTKTVAKKSEKKPATNKARKTSKTKATKKPVAKSTGKKTGKAAERIVVKGRLPRSYGKLKLTAQQRSEVLEIQQDYRERIQKLISEIVQLEKTRDAAYEKVLDKSQRDLLRKTTKVVAVKSTAKKKQ